MPYPTVVQHVAGSNTLGSGVLPIDTPLSLINFWLKHTSQAGNLLIIDEQHSDPTGSVHVTSVTDSLGQTYRAGAAKVNDAGLQQSASQWILENTREGVSKITVTYSTTTEFAAIRVTEVCGIALANSIDASVGGVIAGPGSSSPYLVGSMTTKQDGCYVHVSAMQDTGVPTQLTGYTPGVAGRGFTLLNADHQDDMMTQYQIQAIHGAINCDFKQNPGTGTHLCTATAFRPDPTAGTLAPPVLRVVRLNHNNLWNDNGSAVYNFQYPCQGNLLVATLIGIQASPLGNVGISTMTDSNLNTWQKAIGISLPTAAAGQAEIWYAYNAVTSPNMTLQVTFTGTQSQSDLLLFDISGALPTSAVLGATASTTGVQSVNANLTTVTLTPTTPGSILIGVCGINAHTISGTVDPLFINDTMVYPEADGARGFDEDNGRCHYFVTNDLSPKVFAYTVQHDTGGVADWTAVAAEFLMNPPAQSVATRTRVTTQQRM